MGVMRFALSNGKSVSVNEFKVIEKSHPKHAVYLLARMSRVAKLGMGEADDDRIAGADGFLWYEHGPVGVVYKAAAASDGADVLALTFSNLKDERFADALARGRARASEG